MNTEKFDPNILNNNNNNKEIQACLRQIPEIPEIPVNNLADGNPRFTPSPYIFQEPENVPPPPPPPVSSSSTLNTVSTNAKKTKSRRIETKSLGEYQSQLSNIVENKKLTEQCRLEPLNKLKKLKNKEQIINPGKYDDLVGVTSRLKYYDDKLIRYNAQQKVVEDIIQKILNPQNNNEMNNGKSSIFKKISKRPYKSSIRHKPKAYTELSREEKDEHNKRQREYRKNLSLETIAHRNRVRMIAQRKREQKAKKDNFKGGINKKGKSSRKKTKLKTKKTKKNTKNKNV